MRFSEATGRKVVSTSTADTVGKVSQFVVDPHSRRVVALELKKTQNGESLRWEDITAFGADAVTVRGAEAVTAVTPEVEALSGKHRHVVGKRTLTADGDELGKVADVEFDPENGAVTGIELPTGWVDGARLVGIGSYAVVVASGPPPAPRG